MSKPAYTALSEIYDRLTDQELYTRWKDRSLKVLASYPHLRCGIDAACGSGFFTIAQKKAGYKVTGVDFCREMLDKAQQNALKENLNITFMEQDISALKVFEKVDYITVINDGLNYLSNEKLEKAFKNFYKALNVGGIVYFDFSTEYRLKNILGNNVFAEDYDDLTFLWFNDFRGETIKMDMTIFQKKGGLYERFDEQHTQYVHTLDFMRKSLYSAGFKKVIAENFFGGEVTDTTERIEIIAEK